ncbi:MAG: aminodeoxychorismate/anthranilate synthase component II [Longimicrobiales bacterium]|nr:aminodeoxychorismate/anthranilate synthase component II [Longimicrobiales bacterium]
MSVLVIDNYDSFVHNLVRTLREIGAECEVVRNDEVSPAEARALAPSHLVVSPGPCGPEQAGRSVELIRDLAPFVPLLGVCLGMQCLAHACGGRIVRTPPVHGRTSPVTHDGTGLFEDLATPLHVTRYHSLAVEEATLPDTLEVTARSDDGVIMALRHRVWPAVGVQFHPEALLTEGGHTLLRNFLTAAR